MTTEVSERRIGSNVAKLMERLSKDLTPGKPPDVILRNQGDKSVRSARVRYSYSPQNEDELRLEVNDEVDIVGEAEDGWLKGRLRGKEGVFPSNFCDLIDGEKAAETTPTSSIRPPSESDTTSDYITPSASSIIDSPTSNIDSTSNTNNTSEIMPKKVRGVGLGDIFGVATNAISHVKLRPSDVKEASKVVSASPRMSNSANPMEGDCVRSYVRAEYDYKEDNDDELSFQSGDIVTILNKECEDPGWWFAQLNGRKGMVPDNFFTDITPEEALKKRPTSPPAVPSKPKPSAINNKHSSLDSIKKDDPKIDRNAVRSEFLKHGAGSIQVPPALPKEEDKVGPEKPRKPAFPSFIKNPGGAPKVTSPVVTHSPEPRTGDAEKVTERLASLTADRPKQNKRPPSKIFLDSMVPRDASPICETLPWSSPLGTAVEDGSGDKASEFVRREVHEQLRREFDAFKLHVGNRLTQLEHNNKL